MPGQRILVVDDERLVRWSLSQRLRADGFDVSEAATAAEAGQAPPPDAAILDYKLPDGDGIAVLKKLRQLDPDLPVIMLTAHKDTEIIVEAIKAGASDYITKPFDVGDVALRLSRVLDATRGQRELRRLKDDLARPFSFGSLIGESDVMQRVRDLARKVAETPDVHGPAHGRKRHWQGPAGEDHPLRQQPGGAAVHEHHVFCAA